ATDRQGRGHPHCRRGVSDCAEDPLTIRTADMISRMAPFSTPYGPAGAARSSAPVIPRSYRVRCSLPFSGIFWRVLREENLTARAVTPAIQPVRPPFPTRPAA